VAFNMYWGVFSCEILEINLVATEDQIHIVHM